MCTCDQNLRAEVDAREGSSQILIKQVILYHEVECNYDESRVAEDTVSDRTPSTRVIGHLPDRRTVRVISEENILTESKSSIRGVEWMKKSKSKSQLSLSNLEINVFVSFCFFVLL